MDVVSRCGGARGRLDHVTIVSASDYPSYIAFEIQRAWIEPGLSRTLRQEPHEDMRRAPIAAAASYAPHTPNLLFPIFQFADVILRVKLEAELGDEIELGLEEVDVALLVRHQFLEQIARHVVLHRMAMAGGLLVDRAGGEFRRA